MGALFNLKILLLEELGLLESVSFFYLSFDHLDLEIIVLLNVILNFDYYFFSLIYQFLNYCSI